MIELYFLVKVVLIALGVQFLMILLSKFGVIDYLIRNNCNQVSLIYRLLSCSYCKGFWFGLIIGVIIFSTIGDVQYLFVSPFVAVLIWLMN